MQPHTCTHVGIRVALSALYTELAMAGADLLAISRRCLSRALRAARRNAVRDRVAMLRASGALSHLDAAAMSALALFCTPSSVPAGAAILKAHGSTSSTADACLYILVDGEVQLTPVSSSTAGAAAAGGGGINPAAGHAAGRSRSGLAPLGRAPASQSGAVTTQLRALSAEPCVTSGPGHTASSSNPGSPLLPGIVAVMAGAGGALGLSEPPEAPSRCHVLALSSRTDAAARRDVHLRNAVHAKDRRIPSNHQVQLTGAPTAPAATNHTSEPKVLASKQSVVGSPALPAAMKLKPGAQQWSALLLGPGSCFGLESQLPALHSALQHQGAGSHLPTPAAAVEAAAIANAPQVTAVAKRPCRLLTVPLSRLLVLGPEVLGPVVSLLAARSGVLTERTTSILVRAA